MPTYAALGLQDNTRFGADVHGMIEFLFFFLSYCAIFITHRRILTGHDITREARLFPLRLRRLI